MQLRPQPMPSSCAETLVLTVPASPGSGAGALPFTVSHQLRAASLATAEPEMTAADKAEGQLKTGLPRPGSERASGQRGRRNRLAPASSKGTVLPDIGSNALSRDRKGPEATAFLMSLPILDSGLKTLGQCLNYSSQLAAKTEVRPLSSVATGGRAVPCGGAAWSTASSTPTPSCDRQTCSPDTADVPVENH